MENKIIFHIDANYFFARCEEILDPKLKLVPFVVCAQTKRSVVSTCNLLARELGIKSASKLSSFSNNKDIKIIKPKFDFYHQKSNELFSCIQQFLDLNVLVASVDECYVDVSKIIEKYHNNYLLLATQLKQYILDNTQLYVSIGIGPNKFLAKMANEFKTNNHISCLFNKDIKAKLWPLEINKLYMVGKKTTQVLNDLDIKYVQDFINYQNQLQLKKVLGSKHYQLIKNYCNGIDYSTFDYEDSLPKSISSGHTFEININDKSILLNKFNELFDDIYQQMKQLNLLAITLTISIKFNYTDHKSKTKSLDDYTNDKSLISSHLLSLFNHLWQDEEIRSLTLSISNFIHQSEYNHQLKFKF